MLKHVLRAALVAALVSGAFVAGPAATPARAQATEISFAVFYRELAPYGRWFQHPRWGWAWFPTAVDPDWRPYTRGRWVWTDEHGWYWEGEEPFAWAVYHYGRWAYDEEYGWAWVPGTVWGPAWVAFRAGDGYAGWAPLPPETLYDTAPSYESPYTEMSADYYLPRWVFVSFNYFLVPRVWRHAARWHDNRRYFARTQNVTRYAGEPDRRRAGNIRIVNRSLAPERIRAATGRPVVAVRVNVVQRPDAARPGARTADRRERGSVVNVYRPQVRAATDPPPPATRARPQDRPRTAVRREAVPPAERRHPERALPPGAVTKPETLTRRTPELPPRVVPPSTVTRPQPPGTRPPAAVTRPQPPPTEPPRTVTRPPRQGTPPPPTVTRPQPPTHAAPGHPRTAPPRTVAPQPPAYAPPPRTAPPSAARPEPPGVTRPQPPTHAAPPRVAPPPTVARPPQPPARPAPPATARPVPPAAKPAAPPPAKPAAKPSCGGPGQPPCR